MIDQAVQPRNYLSRVRGVALLPSERVARVFSLEDGLLDEPSGSGQLLIATTQRILFFRDDGRAREATMLPVEELKGIVIETARKGTLSPIRGIVTLVAAIAFYGLVAYWLAGQFDGPWLPGVNMDFAPFILSGRRTGRRVALLAAQRPAGRRTSHPARLQLEPVI